jgi:hypothetical protein
MFLSCRKFWTLHTATKYKRALFFKDKVIQKCLGALESFGRFIRPLNTSEVCFFRGEKIWVGLFIEPQHFFLCFFFYFSVCVFCCAKQLQLESMFFVLSFFFLSTAPRAMHRSSVPFTFKRSRANVQGCQMVCF